MLSTTGSPCISQGRKPFGFSLAYEILATIPLSAPACIRTLANDFNLRVNQIQPMLERLQREHGIVVRPPSHRWDWGCVQVPKSKHASVLEKTAEYFERTHRH